MIASCLAMADDIAGQTERLLGLWSALALQHVALGAACACAMGGVSLRLEDFELDIADYLHAESDRLGEREVCAFLTVPGPIESQKNPVRDVLTRLEAGEASGAVAKWLLARLTRTLESFAKLHGPSASGAA